MSPSEIEAVLPYLTDEERAELNRLLSLDKRPWFPLPGPQTLAYESIADVIGYGGAAGGGKTDLACGKAITKHQKVMVLRREGTQLTGVLDRFEELLGGTDGYNSQKNIWRTTRFDGKRLQIEFGSTQYAGDETKYQGRPHDLLVFDEAANFLEQQVRFLLGWLRSVDPDQRCQALLCFNPPTSAEGRWVIDFFGPWLDPKHPRPARPGELRYFATIAGKELEVDDARQFVVVGGHPEYDFDPARFKPDEIIRPRSRTFIPSRITDNPYLYGTGYMTTLQALPEPLRSQMLRGDFLAGVEDSAFQVIPTSWVEAAQARWRRPDKLDPMDSLGVDVARGGRDNTIIARRHGMWFDEALTYEGAQTPDGPTVAGLTIAAKRDDAVIHIDVIGVGASPYDFLNSNNQQVMGVNVSEKSLASDKSGRLRFMNQRSELWWMMREALDPANNTGIALPPNRQLLADLCAPVWRLSGATVQVEGREEIIKRIGRSPDWASAYCLALIDTPKRSRVRSARDSSDHWHDPYQPRTHDPYA
jgi:hypothetical protein